MNWLPIIHEIRDSILLIAVAFNTIAIFFMIRTISLINKTIRLIQEGQNVRGRQSRRPPKV